MSSEAMETTGQDIKPVPTPTIDSEPFWEATDRESLELQRCLRCDRFQCPPRLICSHCGSRELRWAPLSGYGSIYSYTVVHRPPTPAWADDVPYVVALVDLDEGPRMMTNVVSAPAAGVEVGMRVRARFAPRGERKIVLFEPAEEAQ